MHVSHRHNSAGSHTPHAHTTTITTMESHACHTHAPIPGRARALTPCQPSLIQAELLEDLGPRDQHEAEHGQRMPRRCLLQRQGVVTPVAHLGEQYVQLAGGGGGAGNCDGGGAN